MAAIDFLVDRVGHKLSTAMGEARRSSTIVSHLLPVRGHAGDASVPSDVPRAGCFDEDDDPRASRRERS